MSKIKIYKAKLKTANKTDAQIRSEFNIAISQGEVDRYKEMMNAVDGIEIGIMPSFHSEDSYLVVGWDEAVDEKMREFVYQAEQDPMFGTYIDRREEFLADWKSGEYEPPSAMAFQKCDVEILEDIG